MKINKRNKWLNELIIGDIKTSSLDCSFIKKGFTKLIANARRSLGVSVLMIALNEDSSSPVKNILENQHFIKTKKAIYFITKCFNEQLEINNSKNWELYRSDIDTW